MMTCPSSSHVSKVIAPRQKLPPPSSHTRPPSKTSVATFCFSQTGEHHPEPKQDQTQTRGLATKNQRASEQIHRRDHINNDDVERDLVPKMTSHYESLAEKAKDPAITIVGGKDAPTETTATKTEHDSPSKMGEKRDGDGDTGGKVKEKVVQGAREGYEAVKETVAKAKDYTVEAGHKAAEIAAKPLVAAKDAAVAVSDRAKEGTRASEQRGTKTMDEISQEPAEYQDREDQGTVEAEFDGKRKQGKQGKLGGILGAIGETLVEIAQSTKDMVLGKDHRRGKPENAVVYDFGYGGKRPEHDAQGSEK